MEDEMRVLRRRYDNRVDKLLDLLAERRGSQLLKYIVDIPKDVQDEQLRGKNAEAR